MPKQKAQAEAFIYFIFNKLFYPFLSKDFLVQVYLKILFSQFVSIFTVWSFKLNFFCFVPFVNDFGIHSVFNSCNFILFY